MTSTDTLAVWLFVTASGLGFVGGWVSLVLSLLPDVQSQRDRIAYHLSRGMILFFSIVLFRLLLNLRGRL